MRKQLLIELFAGLLILLFLYASVSKFIDFRHFTGEMNNQPLPKVLKRGLVFIVPISEVLISIALVMEFTRTAGFWASVVLMGLFTAYTLAVLLHLFSRVPCSCGGVIRQLNWRQHFVFNLFFTAIALAGIYLQRSRKKQITIHHLKQQIV
ncbi:MAG: MauE/DoxX family redox-associated membrane protein [Puia sp.]|nr:MauE/DoxX family redox-associated membrane protein [Puia sp.]